MKEGKDEGDGGEEKEINRKEFMKLIREKWTIMIIMTRKTTTEIATTKQQQQRIIDIITTLKIELRIRRNGK